MLTDTNVPMGGSEKPKCLRMLTLMWVGELGMYNYKRFTNLKIRESWDSQIRQIRWILTANHVKKNTNHESYFSNLKMFKKNSNLESRFESTFEKNRISNLDSNLSFSANLRILRIFRFEQNYDSYTFLKLILLGEINALFFQTWESKFDISIPYFIFPKWS